MTAPRFELPLLVVAGMPRTGTTTLYRNFERHPGFETPVRKELNYFLRGEGGGDYRANFPTWRPGKVCVDVSPLYSLDGEAAARIHAASPQAKVVLLLRDPAEWLPSAYAQASSFTTAAIDYPAFCAEPWLPLEGKQYRFATGPDLYRRSVEPFARIFGDNLLLVDYAAFERDVLAILQEIERFAGAHAHFSSATVDTNRNNSSEQARRSSPLMRMIGGQAGIIALAVKLFPATFLRRVRAWLYYAPKATTPAASEYARDPTKFREAAAVMRDSVDYYRSAFASGPIRRGSTLV